jgi:hypothetical protein
MKNLILTMIFLSFANAQSKILINEQDSEHTHSEHTTSETMEMPSTTTETVKADDLTLVFDSNLTVEKDELVVGVSGMVCALCAFGVQAGLSELSFLNQQVYKADGIRIDLDTQLIYIPIDLSKTIDELEALGIINDAGYDTIAIYTNFDGKKVVKKTVPKLVS